MKKLFFVFICTMMIVASCKTFKVLPSSTHSEIDSIYTTKQIKVIDTLKVLRQADTAKFKIAPHEISVKPMVVKSKHATLKLSRKNGKIQAICIADELREIIELQKEIINTYKHKETTIKQNTIIQESKPFLEKLYNQFSPVLLVLVIIGLFKIFANYERTSKG
ncbi:conserved exported hypothetical protein [Tenacibaculum sp. 190524A02b]|uniref:Lipoprotein n=1 Tax=Tenacibaculum vairaonense TaxID=3137860 RepID=A0ABM9PQX3_9FLAO